MRVKPPREPVDPVSMKQRIWWLALVTTSGVGCEIWKAPDRVRDLEGKVAELSNEVSALTGKPVGKKQSDDRATKAEHGDAPKQGAADEHAPKPAAPVAVAEPTPGKKVIQLHDNPPEQPETKGSVASLIAKLDPKAKPHAVPHWAYDGEAGPDRWGALDTNWSACAKGKQQSPIDIAPQASSASPIEFRYKPTTASVVDNGHHAQVNVGAGNSISIEGHTYDLVQLHIHTPSEHTIAGERFPLEVQLVHKDAAGKLAIVGVMYDTGADSRALEPLYTKWPKRDAETKLRKPFDPSQLLPATRTVYRYGGSLTTPPCTEGVVWNVMRRTMSETKPHLEVIAAHYKNARPLQPIGDRKVQ